MLFVFALQSANINVYFAKYAVQKSVDDDSPRVSQEWKHNIWWQTEPTSAW